MDFWKDWEEAPKLILRDGRTRLIFCAAVWRFFAGVSARGYRMILRY